MKRIAIFASGNGSNAQRLIEHFHQHPTAEIALLLSDNPHAYALQRAQRAGIPTMVVPKAALGAPDTLRALEQREINFIVLAGFLSLIPAPMVEAYRHRMVNLHPALLPKYGGRGMHGDRVHRAVLEAGETLSGITIHWVNERYDEGATITQATCPVRPDDTVETLAARIHALEHEWLPRTVEQLLCEGD